MNIPKLYVLIGVSGSGKSTLAKQLNKKNKYINISSDQLRKELYNNINDQTHNAVIFAVAATRIKQALNNYKNVIFDATNLSAKRRIAFLKQFSKCKAEKIAVVVLAPIKTIAERVEIRQEPKINFEIVERQLKNFQFPQYFEGWDNIQVYYNCDEKQHYKYNKTFEELLEDTYQVTNDTIWHSSPTVGTHSDLAYKKFCEANIANTNWSDIASALIYHDVGKTYTKLRKSDGSASYYGHANYGTYLLALAFLTSKDIKTLSKIGKEELLLLFLVNYHMDRNDFELSKFVKSCVPKSLQELLSLVIRYDILSDTPAELLDGKN